MRAEELMTGCWVIFMGGPARIMSIAEERIYFEDKIGEGASSFDKIHPVPLTPAILEQNGWFLANGIWVLKSSPRLGWNPRTKELITGYYTFPATIEYVHQLQILMRMLGVEETIKL